MQSAELSARGISGKERMMSPPNEAGQLAKRVLYGTWDATKKLAEHHSARGWNEWIIGKMNNILPRLSPQMRQSIKKHHEAIETGAKIAGITISTAELYVAFMLAGKGIQKLQVYRYEKKRDKFLSKNPFYQALRKRYNELYPKNPEGYFPLALTLLAMTGQYMEAVQTPVRNADMRKAFRTRFETAYTQMITNQALQKKVNIDIEAIQNRARASYSQLQKLGIPPDTLHNVSGISPRKPTIDLDAENNQKKKEMERRIKKEKARKGKLRGRDLLADIVNTHVFGLEPGGIFESEYKTNIEIPRTSVANTQHESRESQRLFSRQVRRDRGRQPRRDHDGRYH